MIKKAILLVFLCLFFSQTGFTQTVDLKNHEIFFESKIAPLNKWLSFNNLPDSLIKATHLDVSTDKVKLFMITRDKLNWHQLNKKCQLEKGTTFQNILFEKFIFLCDLEKNQLIIEIEGNDAFIFLSQNEGKVDVDYMDKMGEIIDNYIIPIKSISDLSNSDTTLVEGHQHQIKLKLKNGLKDYFNKYESWFENYEFHLISNLNNELIFEINNVVDVVLNEGYFEHLRISFELLEEGEKMNIKYSINAKYGAGIIWAPKNSDYYDMDPKYLNKLQDFTLILKNQIDEILKQ